MINASVSFARHCLVVLSIFTGRGGARIIFYRAGQGGAPVSPWGRETISDLINISLSLLCKEFQKNGLVGGKFKR